MRRSQKFDPRGGRYGREQRAGAARIDLCFQDARLEHPTVSGSLHRMAGRRPKPHHGGMGILRRLEGMDKS